MRDTDSQRRQESSPHCSFPLLSRPSVTPAAPPPLRAAGCCLLDDVSQVRRRSSFTRTTEDFIIFVLSLSPSFFPASSVTHRLSELRGLLFAWKWMLQHRECPSSGPTCGFIEYFLRPRHRSLCPPPTPLTSPIGRGRTISHPAESRPCPRCSPCHDDELLFSKKRGRRKTLAGDYMNLWIKSFSADGVLLFLKCLTLICVCLCSRDLAVIVASIAYNTWFTKLYCKDMRIVITLLLLSLFFLTVASSPIYRLLLVSLVSSVLWG